MLTRDKYISTLIRMNEQHLIDLAARYASAWGMSPEDLGARSVGDSAFIPRLRGGRTCTLRTANKFVEYLSDDWPPGESWLPEVPRPARRAPSWAWISSRRLAALAGITAPNASSALRRSLDGKTWRGAELEVRVLYGQRGRSGKRYQVAVDSLPVEIQNAWLASRPTAPAEAQG